MSARRRKSIAPAFKVGQRVQAHPATSAWMQGDRYGEVERVGRIFVHVMMDRSGKRRVFNPSDLERVL